MPSLSSEQLPSRPASITEDLGAFKQLLAILNEAVATQTHIPARNWYEFTLNCALFLYETKPVFKTPSDNHKVEATLVQLTDQVSRSGTELAIIGELCDTIAYVQGLDLVDTESILDTLILDLIRMLAVLDSVNKTSHIH